MSFSIPTAMVCFIVCHGGPADHFATYAKGLNDLGYPVHIYANGPALDKLHDHHLDEKMISTFTLEDQEALRLAKIASHAKIVITDVGHPFAFKVQEALSKYHVNHLGYYDNPERYVGGGYSTTAAKVMRVSQLVLFANSNLREGAIFEEEGKEFHLDTSNRVGIGYYPIEKAAKIAELRNVSKDMLRADFFTAQRIVDKGQQVWVYCGGNNTEYFNQAFPKFLEIIGSLKKSQFEEKVIIVFQQHPGAMNANIDGKLIEKWSEEADRSNLQLVISKYSNEAVQILADRILYYQTSMSPQFVLAGIPTSQIGHKVFDDILTKNQLSSVIKDGKDFIEVLEEKPIQSDKAKQTVLNALGYNPGWLDRLELLIKQLE